MKYKNWIEYEARIREDEREKVLDELAAANRRIKELEAMIETIYLNSRCATFYEFKRRNGL